MSSVLTALFHRCPRQYTANSNFQALAFGRQFSTSHALLAPRKVTKIRTPSKKAMAAKLKKREKIERIEKMQYEKEKMPLNNALAVLRVSWYKFYEVVVVLTWYATQAVEVSRPKATYEITIKTQMKRATAVPKGRIKLPRDVKERPKDKILVFADGRAAEDAKKAGADIVGGAELVEAVCHVYFSHLRLSQSGLCVRLSMAAPMRRYISAHQILYAPSLRNLVVYLARVVSCPLSVAELSPTT